jgi:hypothetical protein
MINLAGERLEDNSNRRADRKKGQGVF